MPAKMKERQQRFDAKPAAANASMTAMCEVVWVRCREPPPAWLPWDATIVEKCGLLSNRSILSVDNKGDEGYGYLEWIMWRWSTLPPCVYLLHGSNSHLRLGLDLLLRSQRSVSSLSRESLAVPLGDTFVDGRVLGSWNGQDDVRRGLDLFYRHLNQTLGPLHGLPDIRGQSLHLHCCNTWLLTRRAIRSRSLEWWSALRSAALLPVSGYTPSGKTFAGFERTARNPVGHSEIGIIYEHIFHLALGLALNTTRVNDERVFRSVFNASASAADQGRAPPAPPALPMRGYQGCDCPCNKNGCNYLLFPASGDQPSGYRLGDVFRFDSFRRLLESFHLAHFPNSIASRYLRATTRSGDYVILARVVREYRASHPSMVPPSDAAILHLRCGDVLDGKKLHDGVPRDIISHGGVPGVLRDGLRPYVKSLSHFDQYVQQLSTRHLILVAGTHYQLAENIWPASTEYINGVRDHFRAKGFFVELRIGQRADDDVVYMAHARTFVSSGGGFSGVISGLVKRLGGQAIDGHPHNTSRR